MGGAMIRRRKSPAMSPWSRQMARSQGFLSPQHAHTTRITAYAGDDRPLALMMREKATNADAARFDTRREIEPAEVADFPMATGAHEIYCRQHAPIILLVRPAASRRRRARHAADDSSLSRAIAPVEDIAHDQLP